jgi:hypothetical protein
MGSWPLMPRTSFFFLMSTLRSFPFRFPGTSTVISRSPIDWAHLYGRAACSSVSFARAAASSAGVSSGKASAQMFFLEAMTQKEICKDEIQSPTI